MSAANGAGGANGTSGVSGVSGVPAEGAPAGVALVTGGSRGLGLQMAFALGEAGARIMLTSRKAGDLEEAVADLQAANIDARWIAADASKEEDIRRVAGETMQRMGDVHILVNNAGATWGAPAEDHPVEAWDKLMNLNVRSLLVFAQEVAKASMIPRRQGRIVNIASIAGLGGNPPGMEMVAYNTSKGAVVNFTRALAAEWGEHQITVNAIAPGYIDTDMVAAVPEDVVGKIVARIPVGRLGRADEIARGVAFLVDENAVFVTGSTLSINGGQHMY